MTRRRVAFTATAGRHLDAIHDWWRVHRPDAASLFLDELRAALDAIVHHPEASPQYTKSGAAGIRRRLLRRTGYHVYYSHDPVSGDVLVRAIWHAVRGRVPHAPPK